MGRVRRGGVALAGRPADDEHVGVPDVLGLPPVPRAPPRLVGRGATLEHKPLEAKLAKCETLDTAETFGETEEGESADVVPLMEALRRSVEAARSTRKMAS